MKALDIGTWVACNGCQTMKGCIGRVHAQVPTKGTMHVSVVIDLAEGQRGRGMYGVCASAPCKDLRVLTASEILEVLL